MGNKNYIIKIYKIISIMSILGITAIIAYTPIKRASEIKSSLHKQRYNQIQYLNSQNALIPEIINITKGYIIHNATALKDIVHINMLTKTKSNSIKDIYANQLKIFSITKKLIEKANQNTVLSHNEKFNEIKSKFDTAYNNMIIQHELCRKRTSAFQHYATMPLYKDLINADNINDIICTDSIQ